MKIALEITPNLEPLFGTRDENLRLMEDSLGVRIDLRSDAVHIEGPETGVTRVRGIFADFEAMCRRLAGRCKALRMDISTLVMEGGTVFMQWEMTMSFKKFPSSTLHGSTRLLLDEEGLIYDQRDYYDLWGDIFDNIPWMAKRYRGFMKKRFG